MILVTVVQVKNLKDAVAHYKIIMTNNNKIRAIITDKIVFLDLIKS